MPGSSTGTFTDANEYKASLVDIFADFITTRPGAFVAHLDRAEFRHMQLLQARETLPRVAYVALPSDRVFISFSSDPKLVLVWRGIALEPGEIMLHACGEHLHQRIDGPSRWGLIALSPAALAAFCKTETGGSLPLPQVGRFIRPAPRERKRLLRVHRQAARLAETRPAIVGHPEVVRAMENELAGLLIRCLTEGEVRAEFAPAMRAAEVMQRLERALANSLQPSLTDADLSAVLGVSLRTLRKHCAAFLGVGPRRYIQLKQLVRARTALRCADPRTARIAELARAAGFTEPRRFTNLYKDAYGETPIATLRRAGGA